MLTTARAVQDPSFISSEGCVAVVLHRSGLLLNPKEETIAALFKRNVSIDYKKFLNLADSFYSKNCAEIVQLCSEQQLVFTPKFVLRKHETYFDYIPGNEDGLEETCCDVDAELEKKIPHERIFGARINLLLQKQGLLKYRNQGMVQFLVQSQVPIEIDSTIASQPDVMSFGNNGYIQKCSDGPGLATYHKLTSCLLNKEYDIEVQFVVDALDKVLQVFQQGLRRSSPLSQPLRSSPLSHLSMVSSFEAKKESPTLSAIDQPALASLTQSRTKMNEEQHNPLLQQSSSILPFPEALPRSLENDATDGWIQEAARPEFLDEIALSLQTLTTSVKNRSFVQREDLQAFFQIIAKDLSLVAKLHQSIKRPESILIKRKQLEQQLNKLWEKAQDASAHVKETSEGNITSLPSEEIIIPRPVITPVLPAQSSPIPSTQVKRALGKLAYMPLKDLQSSYPDFLSDIKKTKSLDRLLLDQQLSLSHKAQICMSLLYTQPESVSEIFSVLPPAHRLLVYYYALTKTGLPKGEGSYQKITRFQKSLLACLSLPNNQELKSAIETLLISEEEKESLQRLIS